MLLNLMHTEPMCLLTPILDAETSGCCWSRRTQQTDADAYWLWSGCTAESVCVLLRLTQILKRICYWFWRRDWCWLDALDGSELMLKLTSDTETDGIWLWCRDWRMCLLILMRCWLRCASILMQMRSWGTADSDAETGGCLLKRRRSRCAYWDWRMPIQMHLLILSDADSDTLVDSDAETDADSLAEADAETDETLDDSDADLKRRRLLILTLILETDALADPDADAETDSDALPILMQMLTQMHLLILLRDRSWCLLTLIQKPMRLLILTLIQKPKPIACWFRLWYWNWCACWFDADAEADSDALCWFWWMMKPTQITCWFWRRDWVWNRLWFWDRVPLLMQTRIWNWLWFTDWSTYKDVLSELDTDCEPETDAIQCHWLTQWCWVRCWNRFLVEMKLEAEFEIDSTVEMIAEIEDWSETDFKYRSTQRAWCLNDLIRSRNDALESRDSLNDADSLAEIEALIDADSAVEQIVILKLIHFIDADSGVWDRSDSEMDSFNDADSMLKQMWCRNGFITDADSEVDTDCDSYGCTYRCWLELDNRLWLAIDALTDADLSLKQTVIQKRCTLDAGSEVEAIVILRLIHLLTLTRIWDRLWFETDAPSTPIRSLKQTVIQKLILSDADSIWNRPRFRNGCIDADSGVWKQTVMPMLIHFRSWTESIRMMMLTTSRLTELETMIPVRNRFTHRCRLDLKQTVIQKPMQSSRLIRVWYNSWFWNWCTFWGWFWVL